MDAINEVAITSPGIIFYGPHPCDLCGGGPIVRGSAEQAFGSIRLEYPDGPIYPNHQWKDHICQSAAPAATSDDAELTKFIRDAKNLRTAVEHKWYAWLGELGDGDGITGTGETESEAIKSLAEQYRDIDEEAGG